MNKSKMHTQESKNKINTYNLLNICSKTKSIGEDGRIWEQLLSVMRVSSLPNIHVFRRYSDQGNS